MAACFYAHPAFSDKSLVLLALHDGKSLGIDVLGVHTCLCIRYRDLYSEFWCVGAIQDPYGAIFGFGFVHHRALQPVACRRSATA